MGVIAAISRVISEIYPHYLQRRAGAYCFGCFSKRLQFFELDGLLIVDRNEIVPCPQA